MLKIDFYRENFCFLVVHGQKIINYNGRKVNTSSLYRREDGEGCIKYSVYEKQQSIKEIITNYEEETYREGKSLIILTGTMLRLGISLPCVDIALNFDNIMSIDLNYQTMFRVLTERKNKLFGYYLDFFPNRAIQFLYEYNETYGGGFNNTMNIDDREMNLQSLLYLFNYNGLSISRIDEKHTLKLYDKLITELKLSTKDYSKYYYDKDGIKTIKSMLLRLENKELIDELSKIKFDTKGDKQKKQEKHIVREGKKREIALLEEKEEEKEEEQEELTNIDRISDILNTFTSIIALFSSKQDYDCDNLSDCISKILENLDSIEELKSFCDCNSEVIDVLGCYMERVSN